MKIIEKIKDSITIKIELDQNPARSKTGKSLIVASSNGFIKYEDLRISYNIIK